MGRFCGVLGGALLGAACSETSLSAKGDPVAGTAGTPVETTAPGPAGDDDDAGTPSAGDDDDDAGAPRDDTGGPGAADPCYEPEDGWTENPAARLVVDDPTAEIVVTFEGSHAGFDQALVLDVPERAVLAESWTHGAGHVVVLGPYAEGLELLFGDRVVDTGDLWRAGPASRNGDGEIHGAVTYLGDCAWRIGFEDTWGGGDADYDDILMRVEGGLRQER